MMKRPLLLIVGLAVLFAAGGLAISRGAAEPNTFVSGDTDCDLDVDALDAMPVLYQLSGTHVSAGCVWQGNVDCHGFWELNDVIRILRYSARLHIEYLGCPMPGDTITATPTSDPLTPLNTGSPSPTGDQSPPPAPTATPTQTPTPARTATPASLTPTPTHTPTTSPPSATPTPTATPTQTQPPSPGQTPEVGGEPACQVFPADNPWNTDISSYPLHPNSDAIVDRIGRYEEMHPDFGTVWDDKPIGIPYVIVGGNQPKVPITYYYDDSDPGPYPIPPNVPVEGQPVGEPNTADFGGDRHTIVIDETNCILYETFDSWPVNGGQSWDTGSAAIFDLDSNALRPEGWTSADAAGLPIYAGLVRYSEVVEQGVIDHALRFTVDDTRQAYIHPATHWASDLTATNLPPMGMRFRMKSSYDCSWASSEIRVVCAALKKYGMYVADNGSDWYLSGAPDPRWDDDRLGDLKDIPGDAFEVVYTGDPFLPD